MQFTTREIALINQVATKAGYDIDTIERRSDREFDLSIKGILRGTKCGFSAWLMLSAIAHLTKWTSPAVASMTDYPTMARAGDWSGVRDTDNDRLWAIFAKHVKA